MNKELEESYKILNNFKKENSPAVDGDSLFVNKAIETVLNYIENSIPKEVIEDKLQEVQTKYEKSMAKIDIEKLKKVDITIFKGIQEEGQKEVLQDLLEGK